MRRTFEACIIIQLISIKLKCTAIQCYKNFYGHFSVQIWARYNMRGETGSSSFVVWNAWLVQYCTKVTETVIIKYHTLFL